MTLFLPGRALRPLVAILAPLRDIAEWSVYSRRRRTAGVPYADGGVTHASNLKCECRIHHLLKTFWGWRDTQLPDGTGILLGHTLAWWRDLD